MSSTKKYTNPFDYFQEGDLHKAFEALVAIKSKADAAMVKAESVAGFSEGLSFEPLASVGFSKPNLQDMHLNRNNRWGNPLSIPELKENVNLIIDQTKIKIAAVREHNKALIEHNEKVKKVVVDTLSRLGIKETYTTHDYPTARSRNKRTDTHTSGYILDLKRVMPTSDADSAERELVRFEDEANTYINNLEVKAKEEALQNDERVFAKCIMEIPTIFSDLLGAKIDLKSKIDYAKSGDKRKVILDAISSGINNIISADKYLNLAYRLEQNRKDHSGTASAEQGLNEFNALMTTEEDRKISYCIQEAIHLYTGDGRIFQRCEYGYPVLKEKFADQILSSQLENLILIKEKVERL